MDDEEYSKKLDNTINKIYEILKKNKDTNKDLEEAYNLSEDLVNQRKNKRG